MTEIDDREYHTQRARVELDMAYRAERPDVASAHLRLSSLHMQRAGVGAQGLAALPPVNLPAISH